MIQDSMDLFSRGGRDKFLFKKSENLLDLSTGVFSRNTTTINASSHRGQIEGIMSSMKRPPLSSCLTPNWFNHYYTSLNLIEHVH